MVAQADSVCESPLLGISFMKVAAETLSPSDFPLVQRYSISSEFLGWSIGTIWPASCTYTCRSYREIRSISDNCELSGGSQLSLKTNGTKTIWLLSKREKQLVILGEQIVSEWKKQVGGIP
jgi:hypothetical protein